MRRALASLLLVLWMAGFCLPLLQAQSQLPACCRRGGKHHCQAPPLADGYRAIVTACPHSHFTALPAPLRIAMGGGGAYAIAQASHWQRAPHINSPDITRYLAEDTYERGPPLA